MSVTMSAYKTNTKGAEKLLKAFSHALHVGIEVGSSAPYTFYGTLPGTQGQEYSQYTIGMDYDPKIKLKKKKDMRLFI